MWNMTESKVKFSAMSFRLQEKMKTCIMNSRMKYLMQADGLILMEKFPWMLQEQIMRLILPILVFFRKYNEKIICSF